MLRATLAPQVFEMRPIAASSTTHTQLSLLPSRATRLTTPTVQVMEVLSQWSRPHIAQFCVNQTEFATARPHLSANPQWVFIVPVSIPQRPTHPAAPVVNRHLFATSAAALAGCTMANSHLSTHARRARAIANQIMPRRMSPTPRTSGLRTYVGRP